MQKVVIVDAFVYRFCGMRQRRMDAFKLTFQLRDFSHFTIYSAGLINGN